MNNTPYTAQQLWQYYQPGFLQTTASQPPKTIDSYIQQCCAALLSQGVSWEVTSQIRSWMQASIYVPLKPKKLSFPEEERKTPPASPEVGSTQVRSGEVQVKFSWKDWERTKAKISSYNRQLENQRQKSVRPRRGPYLIETPYIKYVELGPAEVQIRAGGDIGV